MQHSVQGFPTVNLPNVCTNAPQHGQAFCAQHSEFLSSCAPEVPLGLRDFLKILQSRYIDLANQFSSVIQIIFFLMLKMSLKY